MPKTLVACIACRKRRVKCDANDPCTACRVAELPCSFDIVRSPWQAIGKKKVEMIPIETAQYITSLEARIQHLESDLVRLSYNSNHCRNDRGTSSMDNAPWRTIRPSTLGFVNVLSDGSQIYMAEAQRQSLFRALIAQITKLLGNGHQYVKFCRSALEAFSHIDEDSDTNDKAQALEQQSKSPVTHPDYNNFCHQPREIEQCVNAYFEQCNARVRKPPVVNAHTDQRQLPILDRRQWSVTFKVNHLLDSVSRDATPAEIENHAISLMVVALGSHLIGNEIPGQSGTIGYTMFCQARSWWGLLTNLDSRITTLQSGLILSCYLERANRVRSATVLIGKIGRVAQYMGLHRSTSSENISQMDHVVRQDLFWSLHIIDNALLWTTGLPMLFANSMYDQKLPEQGVRGCLPASIETEAMNLPFYAMCRLAEISADIYTKLYSPGGLKISRDVELRHLLRSLSDELNRLVIGLPRDYRPLTTNELLWSSDAPPGANTTSDDSLWTSFRMMYYHIVLQLHRAVLIDPMAEEDSPDHLKIKQELSPWEMEARQIALASARWAIATSPFVNLADCTNQTSTGLDFHIVNTAMVLMLAEAIVRPRYQDTELNLAHARDTLQRLLRPDSPLHKSPSHLAAVTFINRILDVAELASVSTRTLSKS